MSERFYSDPQLYDLLFPPGEYARFYAEEARRAGGPVLELACGTGQLLLPIARGGTRCVGIDLSPEMLGAAAERLRQASASAELVEGDIRSFDLGESFSLVFIARNSLLTCTRRTTCWPASAPCAGTLGRTASSSSTCSTPASACSRGPRALASP